MRQNQHRILFIEPPFYRLFKDTYSLDRYPLSLGYLAGTVKKETDWNVMAYNADFYPGNEPMKVSYLTNKGFANYLDGLKDLSKGVWGEVKSTILEYEPSVVGISAKSQNFASACMVARLVKEISKEIVVLVGGPHPSMVGSEVLGYPEIDVAVIGEGERTIVELLKAIKDKKGFGDIKGIIYKKNDQIIENFPRELIKDLDSLCFPHQAAPMLLKDYNQYPKTAFENIFAIRGCPFNCLFCGSRNIWTRRVRFRSPENVTREMKNLQNKGLRRVHFDDDTFGVNKQYIKDLCDAIITHCPGLKWDCEMNVRLVDEEALSIMKKAGCYSIQLGIESGNNEILKTMRKNITIEQALAACKIIKKYGIMLHGFFMVGFPQETEETLEDTVVAMKKSHCDYLAYSIFTPYPGTEAFELCKNNGLIGDDFDISLYNHQSPTNCFCMNIAPERFRALVSKIEKMVDKRNSLERAKRIFSRHAFWKIKEIGIVKGFKRGARVLVGK